MKLLSGRKGVSEEGVQIHMSPVWIWRILCFGFWSNRCGNGKKKKKGGQKKTTTFQLRWCDLPPEVSVLPYDVIYLSLGQWVVIFNKKGSYIAYVRLKACFNVVLNYMS